MSQDKRAQKKGVQGIQTKRKGDGMKWTSDHPTEVGFYWWIQSPSCMPSIARVYDDGQISRKGGKWWPEKIEPPESDNE